MDLIIFIYRKRFFAFPWFYCTFRPGDNLDRHHPICLMQDVFNRIDQPGFDSFFHNDTVDNDIDIMLNILFQLDLFIQLINDAVDPRADVARFFCRFQKLYMLTFSAADDWR